MEKYTFSETKFMTVNFFKDWIEGIKDFLGYEQRIYGDIVNETVREMLDGIEAEGEVEWFRMEVDRTFSKTLQITIYGAYKRPKVEQ